MANKCSGQTVDFSIDEVVEGTFQFVFDGKEKGELAEDSDTCTKAIEILV